MADAQHQESGHPHCRYAMKVSVTSSKSSATVTVSPLPNVISVPLGSLPFQKGFGTKV